MTAVGPPLSVHPDHYVRATLARLEADFRRLALLALAAWDDMGVVAPELFTAIATLQQPSWRTWNGLVAALQAALAPDQPWYHAARAAYYERAGRAADAERAWDRAANLGHPRPRERD
jgi:predicted RNA polymerase sigma factor